MRILLVVCCLALGLVGCGEKAPDAGAAVEKATEAVQEAAAETITPAVEAVLAKADLADGTEDHVVAKCPGCALAMEGSADHAAQFGDYDLHFCSAGCKEKFEAKPTEALLALAETGDDGAATN